MSDPKSMTDKELINGLFVVAVKKPLFDELRSRAAGHASVYDYLASSFPSAAAAEGNDDPLLGAELRNYLADTTWNFSTMDDPEYAREFCSDTRLQRLRLSDLSDRQAGMYRALKARRRQWERRNKS